MDKNTAKGWMYSKCYWLPFVCFQAVEWFESHLHVNFRSFGSAINSPVPQQNFRRPEFSCHLHGKLTKIDIWMSIFLQMIWEYHSVMPRSLEYWNDSVSIIDHWKQPTWSFKTMLDCQGLTSAPLQTSWICFCYNLHNKNPKLSINYPMNPGTFFLKMVPEKPPNRYIPNSSS